VANHGRALLKALWSAVAGRPWSKDSVLLLTPEELARVEAGSFLTVAAPLRPQDFTVTTWNICYGTSYEQERDALASVMRSDVLLLQEVDRMTHRTRDRKSGLARNVPVLLARDLGMQYAYGIEFQELKQDGRGQPAFTGQQTLSTYPLSHQTTVRFTHQLADWSRGWLGFMEKRNGGRMFLYNQAQIGGVPVHLYNVHLESRATDEEKTLQVHEILAHVERIAPRAEPVIIAGDLNTRDSEKSAVVKLLLQSGFTDPFHVQNPAEMATNSHGDKRLDWVFSRNLVPIRARVAAAFWGSDHRALSVSYRMPRLPSVASR